MVVLGVENFVYDFNVIFKSLVDGAFKRPLTLGILEFPHFNAQAHVCIFELVNLFLICHGSSIAEIEGERNLYFSFLFQPTGFQWL